MKKTLSLISTEILICIFVICIFACNMSVKASDIRYGSLIQIDDAIYVKDIQKPAALFEVSSEENSKSLLEYFREQTESFAECIDVSAYNIPKVMEDEIYKLLILSSPRSYYLFEPNGEYTYSIYSCENEVGEEIIKEIYPCYALDIYDENNEIDAGKLERVMPEVLLNRLYFDNEICNIREGMTLGMSDIDKLVYFHDYMLHNYDYAFDDYYENIEDRKHNTAVQLVVDKIGMCMAYSMMYNYLAMEEGIETAFITSYDKDGFEYHTWNMVYVKSAETETKEWYHVDVSWDDTSTLGYGAYTNRYLLISDDLCRESHEWDGISYPELTVETSAALDDVIWRNSDSMVIRQGSSLYFLKYSSQDSRVIMYAYVPGRECKEVYSFSDVWHNYDNMYYEGAYTGLGYLNGRFYFNTSTKIMEYDPYSGTAAAVYENELNNKLIYSSYIEGVTLHYGILNKDKGGDFIIYGGCIDLAKIKISDFRMEDNWLIIEFTAGNDNANSNIVIPGDDLLLTVADSDNNIDIRYISTMYSTNEEISLDPDKEYKVFLWEGNMKPVCRVGKICNNEITDDIH